MTTWPDSSMVHFNFDLLESQAIISLLVVVIQHSETNF